MFIDVWGWCLVVFCTAFRQPLSGGAIPSRPLNENRYMSDNLYLKDYIIITRNIYTCNREMCSVLCNKL